MHHNARAEIRSHVIVALITSFLTSCGWAENDSCNLHDQRQPGDLCRVKLLVRSEGKLKVTDAEDQEREFPVKVAGHLEFHQRLMSLRDDVSFATRHYTVAKSQVAGGDQQESIELASNRRTVAVMLDEDGITRRALQGAISHAELDLLDTPGDPQALYGLLPNQEVRVGERWVPDDEAIRKLLNFQTVGVNETKIELLGIQRGLALMKLTGTVRGMSRGAVSDVRLRGDLRFDLNWERISWLQLVMDDNRDAGPTSPAARSLVEVRLLAEPAREAPELDRSEVTQLSPAVMKDRKPLLKYKSNHGFSLLHERVWVPVADQHRRTIFRLVDRDQVIAQCHVARLPDNADGKHTSLEEFDRDIQSALGDKFGQMVQAKRIERRDGVRVLKAIAEGTVQDIPVRWIYYHLADGKGSRASIVFTLDTQNMGDFADHDRVIAGSLSFVSPATPLPTPSGPSTQTANEPPPARR